MSSINCAAMSGNITRDPELRHTASGTPVLTFSIASNHPRKDANGEWTQEADFFDWEVYGSRAESLAPYLYKGHFVALSGKARQSRWEKDGKKYSRVVFVVNEIDLGPRMDEQPQPQRPQPKPASSKSEAAYEAARNAALSMGATIEEPSVYDHDIPF